MGFNGKIDRNIPASLYGGINDLENIWTILDFAEDDLRFSQWEIHSIGNIDVILWSSATTM